MAELFGLTKKPQPLPPPKPQPVVRMPDEFDPVAQAERRRVRAEALAGKGRAATELAKPAMGATSYENAVLGE